MKPYVVKTQKLGFGLKLHHHLMDTEAKTALGPEMASELLENTSALYGGQFILPSVAVVQRFVCIAAL